MIKGLIFDLDGTLIDSVKDITTAINITMVEYGCPKVSEAYVRAKTGNGFKRLVIDCIQEKISEEKVDEITKRYAFHYENHYCEKTAPYDGVLNVLKKLQNLGIKMCVNSNKKDEYTKELMKHLFPEISFVEVNGERSNIPNKPNPFTALEMLDKMKLKKQEVYYVGDSEVDIATARNAGLKSFGCLWGFRDKETLYQEGATQILSCPQEIIRKVEEENEKSVCKCKTQ